MSTAHRKSFPLDIVTGVLLLGMFALTAAVYDRLPDPMPTHFDLDGRPNGWMSRSVGAWFGPLLAVGLFALLRLFSFLMPSGWRERLEASPVRVISLLIVAVLGGSQVLILRASLSTVPRLGGAIWVLLGALFIVMGLVLPRTRRNPYFGVRTPFALASDENWARTQRVGGYAMTIGGVVALVAGLLKSPGAALAAIIVSAVAPVLWSWILARRGTGNLPPMSR
jgi:uncharacterized membrane protein